jgi:hypothetical protein
MAADPEKIKKLQEELILEGEKIRKEREGLDFVLPNLVPIFLPFLLCHLLFLQIAVLLLLFFLFQCYFFSTKQEMEQCFF